MSFSNLPSQLVAIFIGWVFTIFLQHKANIRAESIRKKDKIIDRIDKLVEWAEKHSISPTEGKTDLEEIFSAMVSQIEIRTINLNRLLRSHSVPMESVALIRSIDILDTNAETLKKLRVSAVNLAEELEVACDARYFSSRPVCARLAHYLYELNGITAGALTLIALLLLIRLVESTFL